MNKDIKRKHKKIFGMKEQIKKLCEFITKNTFGRKYDKRRYEIAKELFITYKDMTAKDAAKAANNLIEALKAYD